MTSASPDPTLVACERCGVTNPRHARFCHSCGARLDTGAVPQEERKLVSVLFVDLVGFTSTSDRADPEDVRDLLEEYHAAAKGCIEQFGGIVEKFIGDAVMAVFGVPASHGDDAERAVRAGLRVLEDVEKLGLVARAAVNTGEAVVRLVDPASGDAIALGDVVNTASRLQSHAPSGSLVVGEETQRATRNAIRYLQQSPVSAKGKADPVRVWLAVETLGGTGERPITQTPFVGRGRELDVIRAVWEQAIAERRPHLVTVFGNPGVGKSRLCREVSAIVQEHHGQILRGRCLPYEEKTGYQAFTQIVRQVAGIFDSDTPAVAREKLGRSVESLFPPDEVAGSTRDLALILGLELDERAGQQRVLFFSARRLIERLGEERPTLVVVEDIHWGATSELDLLEYLGAHVRETRVLFVALARPELVDLRPSWGAGTVAQTRISLEPFATELAAEMATGLLPNADAGTLARLVDVAEGNPLFIEELAAALGERGATDELPVTVRAVIAARVDSLPPNARAALLAAAVVGRTFWQDVLRAVGGVSEPGEILEDLERRDFIRREPTSRLEGDVEFRFKHALIRDVAYGTLPRATRRELHAATARFVEARGDGGESVAWVLAHHWREAGEPEKAIPHLLAAAAIAQHSWATDAVVDLYSQAIELTADDASRARLRLQRGMALVMLGDHDAALDDLEAVVVELEGQDLLDTLLYAARAYIWKERDGDAIETAQRALELATRLGDADGEVAATAVLSAGLAQRGDDGDIDRAVELGDDALRRWRRGHRDFERADHSHLHADVMYWIGDYERAVELGAAAHQLGRVVHSTEAVLRGGGLGSMSLAGLGRHEEALGKLRAMLDVAVEFGSNPMFLLNYLSLVHRELNDLSVARQLSEQALELTLGVSFGMPGRFARSDLLMTSMLEGDIGRAQVDWPALWEDAEQATAWTKWLIYGRLAASRAEIALQAETPEAALEWAEKAIRLAVSTRRRKYEALARTTFGEALAQLRRRHEAIAELEAAVRITDDMVGPYARFNARAALARSAYALGVDEVAAKANSEARALVDEFVATLAPERGELVRSSHVVQELFASS